MKGHGEKFSRKREQALAALLEMPTIGEAAKKTGVSAITLWRWLQDAEFQSDYRSAKREITGQAITRLQQASIEAVETLRQVMGNNEVPAAARVSAARTVLDVALKGVELEDFASRIESMERSLEQLATAR